MAVPTTERRMAGPGDRPPTRPRSRTTWRTGVVKGLIVLLCVCVLIAGGGYLYVRHQLGRIKRVAIPGLQDDQSGQAMNVLLVGSDSRANTSGALADAAGKAVEGDRAGLSDTMMVLHIDPKQGQAAVLSIPRDLWVTVAGSKDRVNSA
ncbi:MAG: LCP family protein, partial [Actinomycetota bacterium]|nr:LCP family protein [Actinomycetota bacterium]